VLLCPVYYYQPRIKGIPIVDAEKSRDNNLEQGD
jgi:hypothetical protein